AEVLKQFADTLEKADDFNKARQELIRKTIREHKRIIFNGNGYDDSWIEEAEKRGLLNLKTTADAMPKLLDKKNVDMLTYHKIFTESELHSRCDIMLENYTKTFNIEANTMVDMVSKQILPALSKFSGDLAKNLKAKEITTKYETGVINTIASLMDEIFDSAVALENAVKELKKIDNAIEASAYVRDVILPAMDKLRKPVDEAETLTAEEYWPFPTYDKLLFSVR
ncbi:MAG: glutamine synthetase type III, partial [Ruminococcus sp.]|nr:glutamine synthetase type III [Ruminococcus sp.]